VSLPSVGQIVRIIYDLSHLEDAFTSRVVDMDMQNLCLDVPLSKDGEQPDAERKTDGFFIEYSAVDGSICRFPSVMKQVVWIPHAAWQIDRPRMQDVTRDQRREFVRVPVDLPIKVEYTFEGKLQAQSLRTRDISAGGLAVLLPRTVSFRPGMLVQVKCTLPHVNSLIEVRCLVIWVSPRNQAGYASASLQFMSLPERTRQKVVQFTFWRQRNLG